MRFDIPDNMSDPSARGLKAAVETAGRFPEGVCTKVLVQYAYKPHLKKDGGLSRIREGYRIFNLG